MGIPVRLSDDLFDLAKQAADEATRSITAQVEHWALIGRAVENALDHGALTALKTSGGDLKAAIPDAAQRQAAMSAVLTAVRGMDREALRQRIAASKVPLHGIERSKPGTVIRHVAGSDAPGRALHEKRAVYAPAAKARKKGR